MQAYPFSAELSLAISRRYARGCSEAAARLCGLPASSAPAAAAAAAAPISAQPACLQQQLDALFPHPPPAPLGPGERLRVAFVSSDFCDHPTSHLMASVLGLIDRGRVEAFCYALRSAVGAGGGGRADGHCLPTACAPTTANKAGLDGAALPLQALPAPCPCTSSAASCAALAPGTRT